MKSLLQALHLTAVFEEAAMPPPPEIIPGRGVVQQIGGGLREERLILEDKVKTLGTYLQMALMHINKKTEERSRPKPVAYEGVLIARLEPRVGTPAETAQTVKARLPRDVPVAVYFKDDESGTLIRQHGGGAASTCLIVVETASGEDERLVRQALPGSNVLPKGLPHPLLMGLSDTTRIEKMFH